MYTGTIFNYKLCQQFFIVTTNHDKEILIKLKIFITGGNGFVGGLVCKQLLASGHSLVLLTRSMSVKIQHQCSPEELYRIKIVVGNLNNIGEWAHHLSECDRLIHTAAELNDKSIMHEINVVATENLLRACCQNSIKHVTYLSSVGVTGSTKNGIADETEPCSPRNEYEKSKYLAETIVSDWKAKSGIPTALLRPTIVYGALAKSDVVPYWIRKSRKKLVFILGQNSVANFVHVSDLASANLIACENSIDGIYNVANPTKLRNFIIEAGELQGNSPRVIALPSKAIFSILGVFSFALKLIGKQNLDPIIKLQGVFSTTTHTSTKLTNDSTWKTSDHAIGIKETLHKH